MKPLILAATLVLTASAKGPDSETGNVLDSHQEIYQYQGANALPTVVQQWTIAGDTYTYVADQLLAWRWSKPFNLTVNGPVKFAVEKRKLFVIDDDGKQHVMTIVKRALKETK